MVLGACSGGGGEEPAPTAVTQPTSTTRALPAPTATTATTAPTPTATISPTITTAPLPTPTATPVPVPTPTPEVSATLEAEPTPTSVPTPEPTPTPPAPEKVWRIGIPEDVNSTNIWAILGPRASTYNYYVFANQYPTLYTLSDFHFSWVPLLAKGKPGDLRQEGDLWTREVELKEGVLWSDGMEVSAEDMAFTVNTALELELQEGNWPTFVDPSFIDRAEAVDQHTVKFYFKVSPGLARWEYGLSQALIMPKHYWEPIVAEARQAGSVAAQRTALYSHVPTREPSAGEMMFFRRVPGEFLELRKNPNYYWADSTVSEYANGAYVEEKAEVFRFEDYGQPEGDPVLSITRGPYVDAVVFKVYEDQLPAIVDLRSNRIEYILIPQGIKTSLRRHLEGRDIATIENAANQLRFLGFNTRRSPMDIKEFRQAVATLIDKEFITNVVLQKVALPMYTMVPEGNKFWWNPDVPMIGRELTREQRINRAMDLLKGAGFSWTKEPKWDPLTGKVEHGEGLSLDGEPVREIELLPPGEAFDFMRIAAVWIETWLVEAGIPIKPNLEDSEQILQKVSRNDFDLFILGSQLDPYPGYLEALFHSQGGFNLAGYNNPEFDRIAEEFLAEADVNEAQKKAFELQDFIADEVPLLALFNIPILEAYRSDLVRWAYIDVLNGIQAYFQRINGPLSYTRIE